MRIQIVLRRKPDGEWWAGWQTLDGKPTTGPLIEVVGHGSVVEVFSTATLGSLGQFIDEANG